MLRFSSLLLTLVVGALCAPLLTATAHATTLQRLDVPALVQRAEVVVRGQVTSVSTSLERGKVYTTVQIKVEQALKGAPGDSVTLRLIGGRHGDLVTLVHGQPQFRQDERVVVFLERSRPERPFVVTGMTQGKFRVTEDKDGKTRWASAELGEVNLVEPTLHTPQSGDAGSLLPAKPSAVHLAPQTLEALEQQIRDVVRAQEQKP
jgi:hypothetical protein